MQDTQAYPDHGIRSDPLRPPQRRHRDTDAEEASSAAIDGVIRASGEATRPISAADQVAASMKPGATPRTSAAAELIGKLSERILISRPEGIGTEVRIKLKSDMLGGAEVSVRRDANGLTVRFSTDNPDIARQVDGFADTLSTHMHQRTGEPVRIEARVEGRPDPAAQPGQAGAQRDGREGGDGRSRNRRDPWEIADTDGDA